jgi:hypothetical protein
MGIRSLIVSRKVREMANHSWRDFLREGHWLSVNVTAWMCQASGISREVDGVPRCSAGLRMHPTYQFALP